MTDKKNGKSIITGRKSSLSKKTKEKEKEKKKKKNRKKISDEISRYTQQAIDECGDKI